MTLISHLMNNFKQSVEVELTLGNVTCIFEVPLPLIPTHHQEEVVQRT